MIDPRLALEFIDHFTHYGNDRAAFWFIGPEEAGVKSIADFSQRLTAWNSLKRSPAVDIADYHRLLRHDDFFKGQTPKTQPTWRRLIMLLLAAKGEEATLEQVRRYQRDRWGRSADETRSMELYTLPAADRSAWVYGHLADLPGLEFLATRSTCEARCTNLRVEKLRLELAGAIPAPKAVVFYGTQQMTQWERIAGATIDQRMQSGARFGQSGATTFVVTMHPAWRDRAGSNNNEFWRQTGKELGQLCGLGPVVNQDSH